MSTALTLPSESQGFLNFTDTEFVFLPNQHFLYATSALSLLQAFIPGLADFSENIADVTGTITIEQGVFQASLDLSDDSTLVGAFDLPALLESYAALAAITNGQATLSGGLLNAEIITGEETVTLENFDLAAFLGTQVTNLVNGINTTIPFKAGAFIVDIDSPFGPIDGTVDFAGGDLKIALLTPFGEVYVDADFGEDAVIPFAVPTPFGDIDAVVDLNDGNVVASLGFFNITQPLSEFDGSLLLAGGIATLETEVPFLGSVQTELEVGRLASEYVADLIRGFDATVNITDGVLNAVIDGDSDLLITNFNLAAFAQQGAEFFREVDGLVSIEESKLTANVQTPLGTLNGTYDLVNADPTFDLSQGEPMLG